MSVVKTVEAIGRSRRSWDDAVQEVLRRAYRTVIGIREIEVVGRTAAVSPRGELEYEMRVLLHFELVDELEPHG
ncbi:MAG: dodecin domain-containing protein [Nitrospirae bacterium]|nr:dodecin domain-containing protein [Nitrospirota bacterium]